MPPSCSVPTCKYTPNNFAKTSYHEIPSKEPLRTNWVKQIGKLCGNELWQPTSDSAVVCSKHFIESDFLETTQRRRLRPTAIPSVFYMMQGTPYYIPHRRRRTMFPKLNTEIIPSNTPDVSMELAESSNLPDNIKLEAFIQANFLEMLQTNLEMLEVANHFLADYSISE